MDDGCRILLIEDDDHVRDGAASVLRAEGYTVRTEPDGTALDDVMREFTPQLALLDVNLPDGPDGFEIASTIRATTSVPVVFITARDDLDDRLRGFDLGADDYLVKPFSLKELSARVRAVVRRTSPQAATHLVLRDLTIDVTARSVERAGNAIALTPTEFDLLVTLARTPGEPWTKAALLERVWGYVEHAPHLVEVQVSGLRRKLEAHGPRLVVTCRDGSYMVPR